MLWADNLTPSYNVVVKSGTLKLLEPSEPVQAFIGIALAVKIYDSLTFISNVVVYDRLEM
jgi:hypothetical protein